MGKVISLAEKRKGQGTKWIKMVRDGESQFPLADQFEIISTNRQATALYLRELADKLEAGEINDLMTIWLKGQVGDNSQPHALTMAKDKGTLQDYAFDFLAAIQSDEFPMVTKQKH